MIKNPEIAALVPTLLLGLTDPNDYTRYSLDILLQVISSVYIFDGWMDWNYVHYISTASGFFRLPNGF